MELFFTSYALQFRHPFGVSSNTRTETLTFFVRISEGGVSGYGEACLPAYLGGDPLSMSNALQSVKNALGSADVTDDFQGLLKTAETASGHNYAVVAAVDIALHDLRAKLKGIPVYAYMGHARPAPKQTSFTIAIDHLEKLQQKIIEADNYAILKIKAGTRDDKKLIREIRRHTYKPLYVDVNQGWRDKHMVLDMLGWMKEQNVLLVEQPMPAHMLDEMAWVTEKSPLPTIADESAKTIEDLKKIQGAFLGINLKLMKCGGLFYGQEMIRQAKSMGMKIMLGCMAESSCGVSAMTHLLQHADFVDLDAPLLYKNDPFTGTLYEQGRIVPPDAPGIGVTPSIAMPDFI